MQGKITVSFVGGMCVCVDLHVYKYQWNGGTQEQSSMLLGNHALLCVATAVILV